MERIIRNSHFLGAKLRTLRKEHRITLEDLSARCAQLDPQSAPSVSYLSMIESGRRSPSQGVLALIAGVFQRKPMWFLDQNAEFAPVSREKAAGGAARIPFEPSFLFSKDLLQAAIPELLAQTGTTGRQFAHLLIRSHQEMSRNDFPDLERLAESVGERRFPLGADDLLRLCKHHGLAIRWFDRKPVLARDKDREVRSMVRSFYEAPRTVYLNRELQADAARLKFDLASHLGHKVLHEGDGLKSAHATGGEKGGRPASAGVAARMETRGTDRGSQISVLRDGDQSLLYCCHSRRANDMAGNPHVLSVGIDLVPALRSHSVDAESIVASVSDECLHHHGEARIPRAAAEAIKGAAKVLNIAWVEDALSSPARIICPRSTHCPRT